MLDIAKREQARRALARMATDKWMRSGRVAPDVTGLLDRISAQSIEFKFNPNHDPENGQFTDGDGGGKVKKERKPRSYQGMTASGLGMIAPTSGGTFDQNGRYVPEQFAPDPYALSNPAAALAHYVEGSGDPMNYYFNKVDTSQVKLSDFPEISRLTADGDPGLYTITDAVAGYNGGRLGKTQNTSSAATVGGLALRANGVLAIAKDGSYSFDGDLSADPDKYDFNKRLGRTPLGDTSTAFGRQLPGKPFWVYLIGSKPFSSRGRR